jgi:hypothetical protein
VLGFADRHPQVLTRARQRNTTEPPMITKFDSLFAGHVDIKDVGYGGVPVNDRVYPNEHLATVFEKCEAMATLMDRVGYDTF